MKTELFAAAVLLVLGICLGIIFSAVRVPLGTMGTAVHACIPHGDLNYLSIHADERKAVCNNGITFELEDIATLRNMAIPHDNRRGQVL